MSSILPGSTIPTIFKNQSGHTAFGPAVVVLVNSHGFAAYDALKKPCSNHFGRWIFEAFDIIENAVIEHFHQWSNLSVDLRKVLNKTASVKFAPHNYVNPVIVPVHIFALMTLRQKGKIVC